jgi:hypothetical protein
MRLAAPEQAGNSGEKAAASLLRTSPSLGFGNLFLESGNSALRVRESLLHHQSALHQQVGRRRNLSDLAPNQLISLGVFRLITCLTQPIKETGYEILFFGCHIEKKTLFPTLTSPSRLGSKMRVALARSRPFETVFTRPDEDEDDQDAEHFDRARILRKIVRMLSKS